jgi:hypothetical protein
MRRNLETPLACFDRRAKVCIIAAEEGFSRIHSASLLRLYSIQSVNQVSMQTVMQFTFPLNFTSDNPDT